MTLADIFRLRATRPLRASCPFCPGPAAATPSKPLCNVCRREVLAQEVPR